MGFPLVRARSQGPASVSNITSHTVTLPEHVAGDLLVVAAGADGAPTFGTPSGWTLLSYVQGGEGDNPLAVFGRIATSSSESLTFSTSAGEAVRWLTWSITGHGVLPDLSNILSASARGDEREFVTAPTVTGLNTGVDYMGLLALAPEFSSSPGFMASAPSGWTQLRQHPDSYTVSTDAGIQAAEFTAATGATEIAPGTVQRSSGSTQRGFAFTTFAIPGTPNIPPSSGTVVVLSDVSGSVVLSRPATGRVDALSAVSASITKRAPAVGVVTAQSVVTGSAEVIAYNQVSGQVTASSTVSGDISVNARASGQVTSVSTVSGAPFKRTTATSLVQSTSTVAGAIRLRRPAVGQVMALSTVFGALKSFSAPDLPPTVLVRPEAALTVAGRTLAAVSGDATLDSARVPYAMSQVEVALTNPDIAEDIDPRQGVRASLTGRGGGGTTRVFNLGVVSRTVDHAAKTMTLEMASDEALLIDYASIVKDTGAYARQGSLRSVVNYVLAKVSPGASLAAGGPADQSVWVNYALNPTAEVDTQYWFQGTNSTAPFRVAQNGPDGGPYINFGQTAAGEWRARHGLNQPVAPGDVLTYEFDLQTHRDVDFILEVNASGTWSGTASAIQKRGSGWSHHSGDITVTAGTNLNTVQFYAPNSSPGAWDIANLRIIHKSVDRAADLLTWEPGVSAWDFIAPIVTTVGQKLWCDESRVWRLTDPAEYALPGVLSVNGLNATEGSDTITRRDPEVYCTGVVVRYKWRDTAGNQREAIDAAGVGGQVLTIDFDRAYTGPGAAAAILARRVGAGRVQEVTAISDYTATPGMEARISLPSTADQQGVLTSVAWSLTDGLMSVGTKGLLDLQKGSINALTGTIDQLTGTIDQL